jgi:hypothetical protein
MLEKEFEYYLTNQQDLVKKYNGKILVIKDQDVIAVYENEVEALNETGKKHALGTFLLQRCSPGNENTSVTFHSRYSFA